jgi:sialidase-1
VISCSGNVSFPNGQRNNHQGIAHFYSEDNGVTWSEPVDRSESIYAQFDNTPYGPVRAMFVGSGKISQSKYIKVGNYYRLYCSVLVKDKNGSHVNFVLYSDDFGEKWTILGDPNVAPVPGSADEPKADELPDGSVIVSSRVTGGRHYNIFTYTDAAKAEGTWGTCRTSNSSTNGVVAVNNSTNGEIITVPATRKADGKPVYLFLQSVPFGSGRTTWVSITRNSRA